MHLCAGTVSSDTTRLSAPVPCVCSWLTSCEWGMPVPADAQDPSEACNTSPPKIQALESQLFLPPTLDQRVLVFLMGLHAAPPCPTLPCQLYLFLCNMCVYVCMCLTVSLRKTFSCLPCSLASWLSQGITIIVHIKKLKHKKAIDFQDTYTQQVLGGTGTPAPGLSCCSSAKCPLSKCLENPCTCQSGFNPKYTI